MFGWNRTKEAINQVRSLLDEVSTEVNSLLEEVRPAEAVGLEYPQERYRHNGKAAQA